MKFKVIQHTGLTRAIVVEAHANVEVGEESVGAMFSKGFAREEDAKRWAAKMNAAIEESNLGFGGPFVLAAREGQDAVSASASLLEAAPTMLAVLRGVAASLALVPCKDGGQDATEDDVREGKAIAMGKWRAESSLDGWAAELREVLARVGGRS